MSIGEMSIGLMSAYVKGCGCRPRLDVSTCTGPGLASASLQGRNPRAVTYVEGVIVNENDR